MSTSATPLRRSPLHDRHVAASARMAEFAGWEMPIDYGSVVAEHTAVRTTAGVFDLTHLGTVLVSGPGATATIAGSFTNDVQALDVGRSHYSLCLDADAGIIDDLLVYRLATDRFLVVPNAANTSLVTGRLLDRSIAVADAGDGQSSVDAVDWACVAVQGPTAHTALAAALGELGLPGDPVTMDYLDVADLAGSDAEHLVLSRSGYTGEVGYEVFCDAATATALWDALIAAAVTPAGLGSRDTLRLEMGYPLHGNDISLDTTPVEGGVAWACRGSGFVGETAFLSAKEAGPSRRLRGILAEGRRAPRAGDRVLDAAGQEIGVMTSGSFSPVRELGVGMAHLDADVALDTVVAVDVRGKAVPSTVVRTPFVEARTKTMLTDHEATR